MLIVLVTCAALPAGNNTKSVSDDLTDSAVGTNYTYECLDGYNSSSDSLVATCLPSGEWSLSTPTCLLEAIQILRIELGSITHTSSLRQHLGNGFCERGERVKLLVKIW